MTFRRIAILNRGEAAIRFIRSLRELDAETGGRSACVAMFTEPDASAPYVQIADASHDLGPATRVVDGATVSAYCDHDHVIAALRSAGCDAVWPGWGFASEDAAFVARLEAEGIAFIGPSSVAMKALGDKIASKEHAAAAGLPLAPWAPLAGDEDAAELAALAADVGLPLMVKASAGGGGRGIRRVSTTGELEAAVTTARREAERAFGDGRLFMEACISSARHVEVQFVVDAEGVGHALGVRDCSVQRRNQKLIEETPSPVLPAETADRLMEGAARMAADCGYRGVGTAEFLFRPGDGTVSFLEVNSRLQVEHTITEMVTGCDLVRAQLLIAAGQPWTPPDEPRGHAIEARVNAENPDEGFRPAPGRIRVYRPPSGPGVRVDSGVVEGAVIPAEFDSMIAKVIAHAPTRAQAIARLSRALRELEVVIEGGATNKAFLTELLRADNFVDGSLSTSWLDGGADHIRVATPENEAAALVAAAVLAHRAETERQVAGFLNQAQNGVPQNLPEPSGRLVNMRLRKRSAALHVYCVGANRYEISSPAGTYHASFEPTGPHSASLVLDGTRSRVLFAESPVGVSVEVDGVLHAVELAAGGTVTAPAPAMVVEILVAEGDTVRPGDMLAMLEAMKMELPVHALDAGVVRRVRCRPAEQVTGGQVLIELETSDGEGTEGEGITLPPARGSLVDLLFESGLPRPDRIDDAPEEFVRAVVDDVVQTIRAVMLGYDVSVDTARRIEILFGARMEFPGLRRTEHWAALVEILTVFADTEELFGRTLQGYADDGSEVSAQLAFFEFCRLYQRGEEGAPEVVRDALERALAHFGVDSLAPTRRLREALWRLSVAHAHGELRYRVCSSLLRLVIGLAEVGVPMLGFPDLPSTLARVFEVSPDAHPYLADNARQALYVIYKRPLYVSRRADLRETHELLAIDAELADPEVTEEYYEALATTAQTVLPHLVRIIDPSRQDVGAAARAVLRRVHGSAREIDEHRSSEHGYLGIGGDFAIAAAEAPDVASALVDEALQAGARHVEVILTAGDDAPHEVPPPTAALDGAEVSWMFTEGDDDIRVVAYGCSGAEWSLVGEGLGIHPTIAERLEVARLSEFELERVASPERMVAFRAKARANPRDERIFVRAEVVGGSDEGTDGDDWPRWEFEKVYYEGLRMIREAQAGRGRRDRFYRNRLTIYVRPPVAMDVGRVGEIARNLEAPTRRLGLESVNVRTTVVMPDGSLRPTEFVISKPGRHRLDVRTRAPVSGPIQPLTPYEQRVVRARRMGLVYPYEVILMLEGRGSEAGETAFAVERGDFVELDLDDTGEKLVPVERPYGQNTCGIIVGRITNETPTVPEGMQRIFVANDPTRSLGSLAEPECRRVLAAIDIAEAEDLPLEWLAISSGARIAMDSGTENLDWTAHVLRRIVEFTQGGGEINIIVCGINVGAQAYWNAQATMLMHTRGILVMTHDGAMVLTGKRALEYSGSVSAEDEKGIGGADRIMGPNGQAQYVAPDLGGAYAILFDHYRYTYRAPSEAHPRRAHTDDPVERSILEYPYEAAVGGFSTVGDLFDEATNPGRKKPFAIRALMRALVDQDAGHLERWRPMRPAEMVVVWDTAIGGHAVSLLGIESRPLPRFGRVPADGPDRWTGATLFPKASKKLARALNAASGNRPVVVLANLSGFDGSPESLRKWQLEFGAEIGRAVVNFRGPLVFVIVGRYHGGAYVVFSKALNSGLQSVALEGSYASVIGGGPAAAVVFPRVVRKRADQDPEVQELRDKLASAPPTRRPRLREALDELYADVVLREQHVLAAEFDGIHTVQRAVEVGSLDAVIPPGSLRPEIVRRIEAAYQKADGATQE